MRQTPFNPICFFILIFLTGCTKRPHYEPVLLPATSIKEAHNVEVNAHPLSEFECKQLFHHRMIKYGYQPIQIQIKNKSDKTYSLKSADISLPLEKRKKITHVLSTNPLARALGWSAVAIFAFPFHVMWPLFIPAALDSYASYKTNQAISQNFQHIALDQNETCSIPAHTALTKLIFVSSLNYQTHFSIKMRSLEDESILFDM